MDGAIEVVSSPGHETGTIIRFRLQLEQEDISNEEAEATAEEAVIECIPAEIPDPQKSVDVAHPGLGTEFCRSVLLPS